MSEKKVKQSLSQGPAEPVPVQTCDGCLYGVFDSGTSYGECKRYPKHVDIRIGDWCGEYKAKPYVPAERPA